MQAPVLDGFAFDPFSFQQDGLTASEVDVGDWFNNRRLLEPIGNIPPAEAEERYYAMLEQPAMAA